MQLAHHPVLAAHPGIRFATSDETLYPPGLVGRTCVKRWMFWACQHFSPAISVLVWEQVGKQMIEGGSPDPRALACGTAELAQAAAVLDHHLSTREWLVGGQATLVEYAVAAPLITMEQAGLPLSGYPHLLAWFARAKRLPGVVMPSQSALSPKPAMPM